VNAALGFASGTPAALISAIITERSVIRGPRYDLWKVLGAAGKRRGVHAETVEER
jgi:hypothetical protein